MGSKYHCLTLGGHWHLVVLAAAATVLGAGGCSGGPGQSGPPRVEANVEFPNPFFNFEQRPDNSVTLVKITQVDAISGAFFGFEEEQQGAEEPATISEFEGQTSRPDALSPRQVG